MNNKELFIAQAAIREEMQSIDQKQTEINDFITQRLTHAAEIARNIKSKRFYHEQYPDALQWVPVLTRSRGKITIETTSEETYPVQIIHTQTPAEHNIFFPQPGVDVTPKVETYKIHKSFLTGDTWGMAFVVRRLFYIQREDDLKKFKDSNASSLKDLKAVADKAKAAYERAENAYNSAAHKGDEEIRFRSAQINHYKTKRKNKHQVRM